MDKPQRETSTKSVTSSDDPQYEMMKISMGVNVSFIETLYKMAQKLSSQPEKDSTLLSSFQVRYKEIGTYRDSFQQAFNYVMARCVDSRARSDLDKTFGEFYDMYYSVQVLCESLSPRSLETKHVQVVGEVQKPKQFHLPKINLPHFSGTYIEWPNFIAMFDSLIHNNSDLNNIQKMHYLTSVLDKEPLNLVRHLELSQQNYLIAYNILKDRYENKRLIADKHLESILSINSLNTNQLGNGLRKLVSTLKENTQALSALGFDINSWSFILLHIILRKLPVDLRSKFELDQCKSSNDIPTFKDLLNFLETQLKVLETVSGSKGTISSNSSSGTHTNPAKSFTVNATQLCTCCQGEHMLYTCDKFNSMTPTLRREFVIKHKLCFNCLRTHSVKTCQSRSFCRICHGRHHTKLHIERQTVNSTQESTIQPSTSEGTVLTHSSTIQPLASHGSHQDSTMLLGTAIVGIQDARGSIHIVRALLDSGSQVTIITETLAQKLKLPRSESGVLHGLGDSNVQRTCGVMECAIHSLLDKTKPALVTRAIILPRITGVLPSQQVSPEVIHVCRDIVLADTKFSTPGPIDILIGIDLYDQVFDGRRMQLGAGLPAAHASIFGWILMGPAPINSFVSHGSLALSCTLDLSSILTKFWEVEEVPSAGVQDPEDILCEKHFASTHSRDSTGRFIVRLPFKTEQKPLGSTQEYALRRFHNLERKLIKDSKLKEMYIAFMADYLATGHMRPISGSSSQGRYYIPHHGVLKESSSTTKLRAVFDASAPSSSGVSLNQILMPGPKLQQNIEDIILRFRTQAVVFACDIKQMYRQVRLHDDDCKYHTIYWRESPDQPIQQFELTTVTYGVSSAAYLAIRVIHELAVLNEQAFPDAARALKEDTFVDDIITGCSSATSSKALQQQLVQVLAQGGFQLRKWVSNCDEVLEGYPTDHLERPLRFEESGDNIFKILGIEWNSRSDCFVYRVSEFSLCRTKRQILSNIARIYDPCGYLAPVTFFAKVMMQRLWDLGLTWDDPIPAEFSKLWDSFAEGFGHLKTSKIPRFILSKLSFRCELMGFCDASENGYAAVVYLRVEDSSGEVDVHLLLAKSKVAPLKQRLTIPRLELCGAVLLARLIAHVISILEKKTTIAGSTAWCDSSIVLAWLRTSPHKLQTFEGNRVSQVQGLVPFVRWRYVPSALNPADCASRGITAPELVSHPLWWSPSWLKDDPCTWPDNISSSSEDLPGLKPLTPLSMSIQANNCDAILELLARHSSLSRLQRVLAWSKRFIYNARNPHNKRKGLLDTPELNEALLALIRSVQEEVFADQYKALRTIEDKGRDSSKKRPLSRLDVFIDSKGFLRVGGRLTHANLPYDVRHPLLLPKAHHLTGLIIDYFHKVHLHVGPGTLINILRRRFWILSARRVVRQRVFKCHRCYRFKAKPPVPFMGDLPPSRVCQARPFLRVGIDFAGPFAIKLSSTRNSKIGKAYLCVYICLVVKAVHFEVTSDLTTEAFMASFHRFVARRGIVSDVYTDCGKNFQGAKRHLNEVGAFLECNHQSLSGAFANININWHMNPPYAPHMGGLWESAVKSAKQLLKRTIGEQVLRFEELTTIFARAEAVLNSRPLCPLSDDVTDYDTLTPGHFLIGQPLVGLPEYEFDHTPVSPLKRWQLVQQISQHFWRRWQGEYLHNLQQRTKWCKDVPNLQLGDLVLIKEDHTPPLQWRKGRVSALHPGADGVVRVVELRTAAGSCLRAVSKVCPLPKLD